MCPAAGQGALGIEIRQGDTRMRDILKFLNDPDARATTLAERALLNELGGGSQVPIGASAVVREGKVHLDGIVAMPDGTRIIREHAVGDDPVKLGEQVGRSLLKRGGQEILDHVYGAEIAVPQQP
jgi:hydroxymethylbilane synthase